MGDLGEVVTRGVELFRYRAEQGKARLVLDIAPGLPKTKLDERAMHLLLFNLLDNAIKYAGASDAVIVRVRDARGRLTLEVEDHGAGIDSEDARRIFERFYRGKTARSGAARGSGIGLALVKHIARAHGGDVAVRPAEGGGAVFSVTLPVTAAEGETEV
jgi:two-component system phosphate regulon sensor histidine kinase PhoR